MKLVFDFLFGPIGKWVGIVLVGAGLLTAYNTQQRKIGGRQVAHKVEKNNAQVTAKADAAGNKSLSGVGGVRNPYERAD